jgi:transcriptional regulator with XRE-family HTH domain
VETVDLEGAKSMSAFGEKVADLRKQRSLTVKEVCRQVGIPQSRLSELERGIRIPTSGQIDRLEKYFEVDTGALAQLAK